MEAAQALQLPHGVVHLQVQPELRRRLERTRQPDRHLLSHGAAAGDDGMHGLARGADVIGERLDRQAERIDVALEDSPRMDGTEARAAGAGASLAMIVLLPDANGLAIVPVACSRPRRPELRPCSGRRWCPGKDSNLHAR